MTNKKKTLKSLTTSAN